MCFIFVYRYYIFFHLVFLIQNNAYFWRDNVNGVNYIREKDATGTGTGSPNVQKKNVTASVRIRLSISAFAIATHKFNLQIDKEIVTENVEKPRKVTFLEEKQETPVGGSCGRQLVPGLLLVGDQSVTMQVVSCNIVRFSF